MRLILAGCALLVASAGTAFAETRNLTGFNSISANAGTDVVVTVGPAFSVNVTGAGADRVVTRIDGDTLVVERRRGISWGGARAEVQVTMPRVEGLAAASGSDLVATGVNGGNISLDSSSGADLRVSGTCASFSADASSGSDIFAQDLRCESGTAEASSGADARVYASGDLNVEASSGGGIVAYGNPSVRNVDLSSGGSFRRAD